MKLNKFQIIGLLLLIWVYTSGGKIGPIPSPFTPNLEGADLESKVLAAMLVVADDYKIKAVKQEPVEENVVEAEQSAPEDESLFPGRWPRVIIFTDTKNCQPCISYEKNTISKFRSKTYQDVGWSIGPDNQNMIEIIDISKGDSQNKFYDGFDKLVAYNKNITPATPTTVFINRAGGVKSVKVGQLKFEEVIRLAADEVVTNNSLDFASHEDMVDLHNTLHGGGKWTWPGDLKTHLIYSHGVK